jgi:hypothetical protein
LKNILVLPLLLLFLYGNAQTTYVLDGVVRDSTSGESLPNANVLLLKEGTVQAGVSSTLNGAFLFSGLPAGQYVLSISYIGFKVRELPLVLSADMHLGAINLVPDPELLDEAEVRANLARVILKGDTAAFNADAYKVNPNASAQDLLTKMPGVVVEGGKVTAQGEEVKRVLVDGKEFFSNDPNVALQSLPAEIIAQVQVFDDQSDQSKFTGFDDGNSIKTLNIVTKTGKNNGQFGKVFGGYGTDGRYFTGGNMNFFKGDQRWTLLGLSNNINVQNFSTQDIVGALGTSGGGGRPGGRGPRRGGGNGASSDASDFLVSSQGGVSATNALGLNYSDNWGAKMKVSGSYFFNQSDNTNDQFISRQYLGDQQAGLKYNEQSLSSSSNQNHRFNLRMEYTIDERNSLLFRPNFSTQKYEGNSATAAQTLLGADSLQSSTSSDFTTSLNGLNYGGSLLYRHKFSKPSRTLSVGATASGVSQNGQNELLAQNFFAENDSTYGYNQQSTLDNLSQNYSANISYTEPLGEGNMLLIDYEPSVQYAQANQRTNAFDTIDDSYSNLQSALSSDFASSYTVQSATVGYMRRNKSVHFMLRLKTQYAVLSADQLLPQSSAVSRDFFNLLPFAMYRKTFEDKSNLRLFYRTGTNAPDFTQLQTVVNNTSTLQLSTGNPNLRQQVSHNFGGRYRATYKEGTHSFFAGLFGEARQDYIANTTFIARADSVLPDGYVLPEGAQLTAPVNLDGYYNVRSFLSYGFPLNALKTNLNLSGNAGYQRAPGLINKQENISTTWSGGVGAVLGSNISENIDFTLSYRGTYNAVSSSLQTQLNNDYYQHTAGVKFTWLFGGGFILDSDVNQTYYSGLDAGINQNFTLWNAGFGYRFLKDDRAELKLSVFDILNQNNSVSRNVTETYIEDQQTTVLQQYFMLTFTYTFRNFGKLPADKVESGEDDDRPRGGRPGGFGGVPGPFED